MFTDSYLPRTSGVVRAVESAARSVRRRGHRVSIIAPAAPGYIDGDGDVHRVPSVAPPGHPDFPLAVPVAGGRLRMLRGLGLSLVHTHSPFLLGRAGLRAGRTLRLPVVFTWHTLYAEYAHYTPVLGNLARPLVAAYTSRYANRCDRVLISTPSAAERLRADGVRTPVEVLPSVGVEPAEFAGARPAGVRAQFGIPERSPLLVYVGRLAREKDVRLLLDALAGLPETVRLLLAGDGPERAPLEAHAAGAGLADRVVFTGLLPHARVVDLLAAADLFVFPSATETLGLAVLEAMAAGCAVVAVRAGASADLVREGETGRLVAAEPGAFAAAVADLLAHPERRAAMGRAARTVSGAYTQDRIADRLVVLYEEMVVAHGVPAGRHA